MPFRPSSLLRPSSSLCVLSAACAHRQLIPDTQCIVLCTCRLWKYVACDLFRKCLETLYILCRIKLPLASVYFSYRSEPSKPPCSPLLVCVLLCRIRWRVRLVRSFKGYFSNGWCFAGRFLRRLCSSRRCRVTCPTWVTSHYWTSTWSCASRSFTSSHYRYPDAHPSHVHTCILWVADLT